MTEDGGRGRKSDSAAKSPIRVLVVDDHAVIRRGVRASLEAEPDMEICAEAANGIDAIDAAARAKPDVVILDLTLPDLNGLDASRKILEVLPEARILLFTMHESQATLDEALAYGVPGYLLKSDAEAELPRAVRALASGERYVSLRLRSTATMRGSGSDPLTRREHEVPRLVAEGRTTREVARTLGISPKTADTHRTNLMRKLGVHSVIDLVRYAARQGLIDP